MRRSLVGESKLDLAREFELASPKLIETWVRVYRNEGEDGLRPKSRGRRPAQRPRPMRRVSCSGCGARTSGCEPS
ncbi:helix-turn-helix domain-containing protein [Amycolatopsis sp. NPDC051373]|uniref:helix-turn-helix domain-containing protein n=1 Tax=Amycolatopsis sp. NPDC051373 TaxID=3155801 RepID=UPI003450DBE7